MASDSQGFLDQWHRVVSEKDLDGLAHMLADDVALGSPPYWERLRGPALVEHLLGLILTTIEDFTYHREWLDGNELALEFKGHVNSLELQGIDLITLDDQFLIQTIDVVIRPENAIEALRGTIAPEMAKFLSRGA